MGVVDRPLAGDVGTETQDAGAARPEGAADPTVPAGRISVRLAQSHDDIAAMIALGRQLHAESRFRALGASLTERRAPYRALFVAALDDTTNKAWALGSNRFKEEPARLI